MKQTQKEPKQTKLSKQQKKILKFLGKEAKENNSGINSTKLSHLIAKKNKSYGVLSNTDRASTSRSIRRLTERGLVHRRTSYYSDALESHIRCNVLFTTDKGQKVYNKLETVNEKIN